MYKLFLDIYHDLETKGSKFALEGGGGAGKVRWTVSCA